MPHDLDLTYDAADADLVSALPEPEMLPYRAMLEEFETVNVLAPLVRCSKCGSSRVVESSPIPTG
jgi:hypothetical protein